MSINGVNTRPVGAAFGGVSAGHSMSMMSPESLVALCAMQLSKFDGELLERMAEKDKNVALQEKLALLTSKLEGLDKTKGLEGKNCWERDQIVTEMRDIIAIIGNDPNKQELKAHLEQQVGILTGGRSENTPNAEKDQAYRNAVNTKNEKYNLLSEDSKKKVIGLEGGAINWDTGCINEANPDYQKATDEEKTALKARADEHRTYLDAEKARVGEGTLTKEQVAGLLEYTKAAGSAISSRNDTIMMEMQTLVSQRSTSIQMTSNLTNALLEATKNIAANIGR